MHGESIALIAIDWGTSNLRVFALSSDGAVLDVYRGREGILNVPQGQFPAQLEQVLARWPRLHEQVPVLACGMVGARQGWAEVPYVECPASLDVLAGRLQMVAQAPSVYLVPGLSHCSEQGDIDVLRGEETVVAGATGGRTGVFCLPGTHCKWVRFDGDCVISFRTALTGELYDVIATHTLLGRMLNRDGAFDENAFDAGMERARRGDGLLHQLFSVRTRGLMGQMDADAAASYLSGLIVCDDVRSAIASGYGEDVVVVSQGHLAHIYQRALNCMDVSARVVSAETSVVSGLFSIATRAALLPCQ